MNGYDAFVTEDVYIETALGGALGSFGYAAGIDDVLESFMQEYPQAILLDIRLRARARFFSRWNKSVLQARWGSRYVHEKRLGDVNYQYSDKPIELLDPEAALPWILAQLREGTVFVVLCACQDYVRCHRSLVVEYIVQRCADGVRESGMRFDVGRNVYVGECPAGSRYQVVVAPFVFESYRRSLYPDRVYDVGFWLGIGNHRPDLVTVKRFE